MTLAQTATDWWTELTHYSGDRADLRRARTLEEAVLVSATRQWLSRTGGVPGTSDRLTPRLEPRVATAMILAHVRRNTNAGSLARALGTPGRGEPPVVGENRFRRLLQTETVLDLVPQVRRILPLLDHAAPIGRLAEDITWWGEKVRRRWLFEYYGAELQPVTPADS